MCSHMGNGVQATAWGSGVCLCTHTRIWEGLGLGTPQLVTQGMSHSTEGSFLHLAAATHRDSPSLPDTLLGPAHQVMSSP